MHSNKTKAICVSFKRPMHYSFLSLWCLNTCLNNFSLDAMPRDCMLHHCTEFVGYGVGCVRTRPAQTLLVLLRNPTVRNQPHAQRNWLALKLWHIQRHIPDSLYAFNSTSNFLTRPTHAQLINPVLLSITTNTCPTHPTHTTMHPMATQPTTQPIY